MNFDLSDEQRMLQETVQQFIENECPATKLREIFEGDEGHDPVLWKGLVEMGVAGLAIPEEYGGAGLEILDLAVVSETLGYGALPGPFFNHMVGSLAIAWGGSDAQKERWLPQLANGEAIATIAFSDPEEHWQPDQWQLAPGGTLSGVFTNVPLASSSELIVVGLAGGELGIVEANDSGVHCDSMGGADRTRRIDQVKLENARCELLEKGSAISGRVRDAALVLLAADAFGGSRRLLEMCVEYAKTREQFGVVIGAFQGLKHQLADMALDVEPNCGLYWYAAHAQDHAPEEAERIAAIAKSHITDRFMQVARDAVEAHGGIGFTWECDVQIWFKRAMFDRAFLGTPSHHRSRAAALADW